MLEHNKKLPRIDSAGYAARRDLPGQWQVEITWRFQNTAEVDLYVLINRPISTTIADPLILNHLFPDPDGPIGRNAEIDFEIIALPPAGVLERPLNYALSLPETWDDFTVVGRFGYSYDEPDPAWVAQQNRSQIARWMKYVDSAPFTLS